MLVLFVMGLIMPMVIAYDNFAAINCGSYDRTIVSTKYANYTSVCYNNKYRIHILKEGHP